MTTTSETATPDSPGRKVIKLKQPVKFEDIEKTELVLDFDRLSGKDIKQIILDAQKDNNNIPIVSPRLDPSVQSYTAAKAAGVPRGLIEKLCASDFIDVTEAALIFLADL